jgi:hypothetical protein
MAPPQPSADPLLAENTNRRRQRDDAQLQSRRPVLDVAAVEEPRQTGAAARIQLREAGDARLHAPAQSVGVVVPAEALDVGPGQRPRADQAHVTAQHVEQLGDFVGAGRTQAPTDARKRRAAHRTKLVDSKRCPVSADPRLGEQHGSAVVEHDRGRDEQRQRAQYQRQQPRGGEVEEPL